MADYLTGGVADPTHIEIKTVPIKSGVTVTQGVLYSIDANGYLVDTVATSSKVNFDKGIFQAMASVASSTTSGDNSVQCLISTSWIILKGAVGIAQGFKVGQTTAKSDAVAIVNGTTDVHYVGRVVQILDGSLKTAANDLILVAVGAY